MGYGIPYIYVQKIFFLPRVKWAKVSALKQELRRLHGFPLCMQQLLHNDDSLDPAMKLEEPMDLQLVIVPISEMRQFYDSLDEMLDVCHTGMTEVLRQLMDTGLVERAKDTRDAGLLLRNLNQVTVVRKPYYSLYTQSMVT